jgi:hypothetical protein
MLKFITILSLIFSTYTFANENNSQLGLSFSVGQTSFQGDLSDENSAASYDFQIQTMFQRFKSTEIYLAIETMFLKASVKSSDFPYDPNEQAKINTFLFAPTICNLGAFQYCIGLGQGTVNVNQNRSRRDFGTWNYRLLLKYKFMKNWKAFFQIKYVGKVEIEVDDRPSEFTLIPYNLSLSYRF